MSGRYCAKGLLWGILLLSCTGLFTGPVFAQEGQRATITGRVVNVETGEPLLETHLATHRLHKGTRALFTNERESLFRPNVSPVPVDLRGRIEGLPFVHFEGKMEETSETVPLPFTYSPDSAPNPSNAPRAISTASTDPQTVPNDSSALRQAIRVLQEGDPGRAYRHLRPLWEENIAAYVDSLGSVAYWVGRCFAEAKNTEQARKTWQGGMTALAQQDIFDPRLQDAYARLIFKEDLRTFHSSAADAYLELFERAGEAIDSSGRAIVRRRVTQTAPLLPDSLRRKFLRKSSTGGYVTYRLRPGHGDLAAWWRAQDPDPATSQNERVIEHLRRVQHAEANYDCDDCPAGYDDRGKTYVRLGPPSYTGGGKYDHAEVQFRNASDYEIWFYPRYGEDAIYPLVERQGRYRLSGTKALIPRRLRGPFPNTRRGRRNARRALSIMESVYRELITNADYAYLYDDVWKYRNNFGTGSGRRRSLANEAYKMMGDIRQTDAKVMAQRRKQVPNQQTSVHEDLPTIRTAVRPVRFLNSEGQTRTLITWSHEPSTLPDRVLVTAHAVQYDSTYRAQQRLQRTYSSVQDTAAATGSIRTLSVEGIEGTHHLRLQWNAYPQGRASDGTLTRSERTHTSVARFDTLDALSPQSGLLISDLLPGRLRASSGESEGSDTTQIGPAGMTFTPYPFSRIRPDQPLALYFEIYNLTYGPEDRTRYTISYELEQKKEGGVFQLFRDETTKTKTTTEREGASRRTDEIIELDVSEAAGADQVRISVRITDNVTGHTARRSLTFDVVDGSS